MTADAVYLILHGELKASQANTLHQSIQRGKMFGQLHERLRLPEHTTLIAQERCLVCQIPEDIFTSFMRAYGSFEHWVEAQKYPTT